MTKKNMHSSNSALDEALWAAYRRQDKAAVMDCLFGKRLVAMGCSRSFFLAAAKGSTNKARGATRPQPILINGGARQMWLQSSLN
jgi:hypothetical protein